MSNSPIKQLEFVLQKQKESYNPGRLVEDLTDLAKQVNAELIADTEPVPIGQVAAKSLERIMNPSSVSNNFYSGFPEFDVLTGGFRKGELVIIGGRPGVGKTKLMVHFCRFMAERGTPTAYFNFDLTADQLVYRFLSNISKVSEHTMRKKLLLDSDKLALNDAGEKLNRFPIYIDDSASQNIFSIREKCKKLVKDHKVEVVFVDYIQMIGGLGRKNNREYEISLVSRELKQMAKELDVCVIASSQLSRAVEQRGGSKRPQLSDLRESGAIEQDADKVIFIYRPDIAGITQDENGNSTENIAELILAKNRTGIVDSVTVYIEPSFTGFTNNKNHGSGFTISEHRMKELNQDIAIEEDL